MINFDITILYQFANLLILLILLHFLLFKPVLLALRKREGAISSLTERVEKAKQDARDFEKQYDEAAHEKRKPILESKDAAVSEANTGAMKIIGQARVELADELTKIKSDIEIEGKRVYETLRADVERLSGVVAEKILKRSL
jgi:F-type H+-transporting ATPase subunit b